MYLGIKRRFNEMAISCACSETVKNGEVLMLKGLAPASLTTVNGIALEGETYELVDNVDDANEIFVIAAFGAHRYKNEQNYDFGDFDDVSGKPFRGYILRRGMEFDVEEAVLEAGSELAVGDKLAVKASTHKLAKSEGTEKAIVAKVVAKPTLHGKKMVTIVIL